MSSGGDVGHVSCCLLITNGCMQAPPMSPMSLAVVHEINIFHLVTDCGKKYFLRSPRISHGKQL